MTHTLAKIYGKPNDYKQCDCCYAVNWYENEGCVNNCVKPNFINDEDAITSSIEDDYRYYRKEGYSEDEIDNILKDV